MYASSAPYTRTPPEIAIAARTVQMIMTTPNARAGSIGHHGCLNCTTPSYGGRIMSPLPPPGGPTGDADSLEGIPTMKKRQLVTLGLATAVFAAMVALPLRAAQGAGEAIDYA